jgi:carbon starvation protein
VTIVPLVFVGVTTLTAGWMNIANIYLPQIAAEKTLVQGLINAGLTGLIMVCVVVIFADAVPKWIAAARGRRALMPDAPVGLAEAVPAK